MNHFVFQIAVAVVFVWFCATVVELFCWIAGTLWQTWIDYKDRRYWRRLKNEIDKA